MPVQMTQHPEVGSVWSTLGPALGGALSTMLSAHYAGKATAPITDKELASVTPNPEMPAGVLGNPSADLQKITASLPPPPPPPQPLASNPFLGNAGSGNLGAAFQSAQPFGGAFGVPRITNPWLR